MTISRYAVFQDSNYNSPLPRLTVTIETENFPVASGDFRRNAIIRATLQQAFVDFVETMTRLGYEESPETSTDSP